MLDNRTKNRINTARDILVGKVPDPKAQVEQITTALIYKFMHDMDQESGELGGQAVVFSGEYAKYAWSKIMDKRLGGYDRLELYGEAITRMSQNPHIPQLFRDIFKDAFLPYRDPETLNLFLKEIDGFTYDHSERLGDAFEYLLSVLGSQGAAGQFRTPRHIIDFIVQVVAPTKNDTILDPACGTAGFLISAYKHIMAQNAETPLTPDERQRLTRNFVGYDISPDMVRLSLVNMYLHQFPQPTIYEYDTLTAEDRWDDTFDVILANPPFMSPKGGIRPHQRFAIQSKRSEVLFVDYIAEHLNPNGRAGVIVPEGIIFQSSNAYKRLRKMLVDESYLWAVVSQPAGVFNPYSGVKTSILFLDKTLAKRTDRILFVDVQNDGFDLGAQRRVIKQDDLPQALQVIQAYQVDPALEVDSPIAHTVPKEKIAEDGDYNLSGGRYKEVTDFSKIDWPIIELGEICEFKRGPFGGSLKKDIFVPDGFKVYEQKNAIRNDFDIGTYFITEEKFQEMMAFELRPGDLIVSCSGTMGKMAVVPDNIQPGIINQALLRLTPIKEHALVQYVKYMLESEIIQNRFFRDTSGAAIKNVASVKVLKKIPIPLPPIEVQRAIVEEFDSYQAIIDGARQVVENYTPRIQIDPKWPIVELGELATTEYGHNESAKTEGDTRFVRITDIDKNGLLRNDDVKFINLSKESKPYLLNRDDVVIARTGATYGKTLYFDEDYKAVFAGYLIRTNFDRSRILSKYFWIFAQGENYEKQKATLVSGGGQPQFNAKAIQQIKIPVPPIDTQRNLIEQVEKEQEMVESNRQLIDIFHAKIDAAIARVWGEG